MDEKLAHQTFGIWLSRPISHVVREFCVCHANLRAIVAADKAPVAVEHEVSVIEGLKRALAAQGFDSESIEQLSRAELAVETDLLPINGERPVASNAERALWIYPESFTRDSLFAQFHQDRGHSNLIPLAFVDDRVLAIVPDGALPQLPVGWRTEIFGTSAPAERMPNPTRPVRNPSQSPPLSVIIAISATCLVVASHVVAWLTGYGTVALSRIELLHIGVGLLIVVGLSTRHRLAWQWGRHLVGLGALLVTIGLGIVLLLPLFLPHGMPAVSSPPYDLGQMVLFFLLIAAPPWTIFLSLEEYSALVWFHLICPVCGSRRVHAVDFFFTRAKCGKCQHVW